MPHRRLEQFLARHHVRVENAKAYALLLLLCLVTATMGYVAGRIDSGRGHAAELARLQAANTALLVERGERIDDLTRQLDRLTQRTTEAATTAADAARAATAAAEATTAPAQ